MKIRGSPTCQAGRVGDCLRVGGPRRFDGCTGDDVGLSVGSARRLGTVLAPPNKDAALFPRRVGGRWTMLHRPSVGGQEHIWLAESRDLMFWGRPRLVLPKRGGTWWDGERVGAGAPPVETPEGWLLIYHGVKVVAGVPNYRLGVALLDPEDPGRVLNDVSGDGSWHLGGRRGCPGRTPLPSGTL